MRSGGVRSVVRGGRGWSWAAVLAAGLAAVGCGDDAAQIHQCKYANRDDDSMFGNDDRKVYDYYGVPPYWM